MLCFPFAKINLGLAVLNKRSDGFHNIESLLHPIDLFDILEIIEHVNSSQDELVVTGLSLSVTTEENLVWKALLLLRLHFDFPKVKIHLHKQIPSGSGLGGGSSDAAHFLKAINQLFNLKINENQLVNLASEIGSDCPFFIQARSQYASGRGDLLAPFNLKIKATKLLLIIPDFSISTKEAYAKINPKANRMLPKEILNESIESWKTNLKNDFEEVVFNEFPSLGKLKVALYEKGALYVSLSGSGSSMFAMLENTIDLKVPAILSLYWLDFPS